MANDNSAPFPPLRSAYLRAIARAWRDDEYEKKLVDASVAYRRGALPLLEDEFNFRFPFNVKFNISKDDKKRPKWKPVGTSSGWFGFMDDFKIYLPIKPQDETEEGAVLARYCSKFPSLLGASTDGFSQAPENFAAFGVITSRLLALAWSDEDFAKQLYDPESPGDVRSLVEGALDYIVPWIFRLTFEQYPKRADPGQGPETDDYWERFPYSEITVYLPQPPSKANERNVDAIALAAYNDTGGQYPFTCG